MLNAFGKDVLAKKVQKALYQNLS